MAGSARKREWWALIVLALAGVFVHLHQLEGGRPYFRDSHQVYVPAKMWLAERLRAGELPLWWPWDAGGSSLIPQPVFSVFHPSTLLYLVLPFWSAFAGQDLLATWLALFGAYMLARTLGLPRAAALISGVLYGACGYLVCLGEHQFMKLAAGTMPWYLAALLVANRRGGQWLLAPALAMAGILLAGDPQIAILSSACGLVLLIARTRSWRRTLFLALASPVIGTLLAAIQLGPSLAVIPDTERGFAMSYDRWAMPPAQLLGFLAPINHGINEWARSTFVGWAGIGLACASLAGWPVARRRRMLVALWGLTLASVWLALGNSFGLNALARAIVPIWSQLRYPMKSIVVACLTLAVLAGYGAAALWTRRHRLRAQRVVFATAAIGVVATAVAVGDWLAILTLGTAVLAVSFLQPRLGALVVSAQVVAFAMPVLLTAPAAYYEAPPLAEALRRDGVGLSGPYFDRPFVGRRDPIDWSAADRAGVGGLGTSLGAIYGLPCLTPSMPGASWRNLRFFSEEHRDVTNSRLLGVFGVGDVIMQAPLDPNLQSQMFATEPVFDFAAVHLRRRLPRAYVTQRARAVESAADALAVVTGTQFAPGREVILERSSPPPEWASRPLEPASPAEVLPRTRADTVTVRATLPSPGFIVLNEAVYRGWTATIDGTSTPIYAANAFVRAVEAPAGTHEVVFHFDPPGLKAGIAVSAAAWVGLGLAALLLRRRRPPVAVSSFSA